MKCGWDWVPIPKFQQRNHLSLRLSNFIPPYWACDGASGGPLLLIWINSNGPPLSSMDYIWPQLSLQLSSPQSIMIYSLIWISTCRAFQLLHNIFLLFFHLWHENGQSVDFISQHIPLIKTAFLFIWDQGCVHNITKDCKVYSLEISVKLIIYIYIHINSIYAWLLNQSDDEIKHISNITNIN